MLILRHNQVIQHLDADRVTSRDELAAYPDISPQYQVNKSLSQAIDRLGRDLDGGIEIHLS